MLKGRLLPPVFLAVASALAAQGALAQAPEVPANIGGALEQSAPPRAEEPKPPPPLPPVGLPDAPEEMDMAGGETLLVKAIRVEGSEERDWRRLQELLSPYLFKELTMAEVTEASNLVTLYYRDHGDMTAKAYVPRQDATGGVLVIRLLLGRYGGFEVWNSSPVRTSFLRGVFESVKRKSPVVRRKGLERAMLLLGETPGGGVPTVTITAGEEPGTSDFLIDAAGSPRLGGYAAANNQGSRHTGEYRMYAGGDVNSPLGFGDRLSAGYMATTTGELGAWRLSYGFPLAHNGLRAEFSAARTEYELGGAFSALGATGEATIYEGAVRYPLRKGRGEDFTIEAKVVHKRMEDDMEFTSTTPNEVTGELPANAMEPNRRNSTAFALTLGREGWGSVGGRAYSARVAGSLAFGNLNIVDAYGVNAAVDAAGPRTAGMFSKLNLEGSGTLELAEGLALTLSAKFQKALLGGNLDSTEQMFVNGAGGVRAWTESVGYDNGRVFSAELRRALPGWGGVSHAALLFADDGRAWVEDGGYTATREFSMSDAGPGYAASYRWLFVSVHVAVPVGGMKNVSDPGVRVLWQAGVSF